MAPEKELNKQLRQQPRRNHPSSPLTGASGAGPEQSSPIPHACPAAAADSLCDAQNTKFLQPLARSSSKAIIMSKATCQGTGERPPAPVCLWCSAGLSLPAQCWHRTLLPWPNPPQTPSCTHTNAEPFTCSSATDPAHLTAVLTGNGRKGR